MALVDSQMAATRDMRDGNDGSLSKMGVLVCGTCAFDDEVLSNWITMEDGCEPFNVGERMGQDTVVSEAGRSKMRRTCPTCKPPGPRALTSTSRSGSVFQAKTVSKCDS